ncbi:hypothetical protein ABWH96_02160 [Marivirga tractuosa]|uniref:hypothetical protein n=1 Tax=Marivirga tractuosa TaxID=1006 RepID=UPI0035D08901
MKNLSIERMEKVQGGQLEWLGCGAGMALVVLSVAPTGLNIAAFATGVGAIAEYC